MTIEDIHASIRSNRKRLQVSNGSETAEDWIFDFFSDQELIGLYQKYGREIMDELCLNEYFEIRSFFNAEDMRSLVRAQVRLAYKYGQHKDFSSTILYYPKNTNNVHLLDAMEEWLLLLPRKEDASIFSSELQHLLHDESEQLLLSQLNPSELVGRVSDDSPVTFRGVLGDVQQTSFNRSLLCFLNDDPAIDEFFINNGLRGVFETNVVSNYGFMPSIRRISSCIPMKFCIPCCDFAKRFTCYSNSIMSYKTIWELKKKYRTLLGAITDVKDLIVFHDFVIVNLHYLMIDRQSRGAYLSLDTQYWTPEFIASIKDLPDSIIRENIRSGDYFTVNTA
jgi:hypothetical protein